METIYTEQNFFRVHISRKMVDPHHDHHPGKNALISIDHGFNWDTEREHCRHGDFILFQNYVIKPGRKLTHKIGCFYGYHWEDGQWKRW